MRIDCIRSIHDACIRFTKLYLGNNLFDVIFVGHNAGQNFIFEIASKWIGHLLQNRGDISAQVIEQEKLPARQILRITELGRRRFFEWLELGIGRTARSIRLEFLTRLYFTQLHRPENIAQIHKAQSAEIESTIARLESLLEHLPPDQVFNRLSLNLRLQQMRLIQNWVADIQTQLHISGS